MLDCTWTKGSIRHIKDYTKGHKDYIKWTNDSLKSHPPTNVSYTNLDAELKKIKKLKRIPTQTEIENLQNYRDAVESIVKKYNLEALMNQIHQKK